MTHTNKKQETNKIQRKSKDSKNKKTMVWRMRNNLAHNVVTNTVVALFKSVKQGTVQRCNWNHHSPSAYSLLTVNTLSIDEFIPNK